MKTRALWVGGVAVGALVWVAAPELSWPARLFCALTLGPAPVAALFQAAAMEQLPQPFPRVRLYIASMFALIVLAVAALATAGASHFTRTVMGLRGLPALPLALWTLYGVLAAGAIVTAFKALGFRESEVMREITPVTLPEKVLFVGLAMAAGFSEEIMFRSFLLPALIVASGSVLAGVGLSAAAFGLLHAHQRAGGALRAALLGVVLSVPFLLTGSVLPAMAAHALIDLLGGLWLARWLLK